MKKRSYKSAALLTVIGLLMPLAMVKAEPTSDAMEFGYKTYFHFHPPQDKALKHNLYPFEGAPIPTGADIPVCAAARTAGAYARKRDLRYILHGKDGWLFRTIDFRTDFTASPETLDYFKRLNNLLKSKGQTLVIALQPPRAVVSAQHIDFADMPKGYSPEKARAGYEAFLQQLDKLGIVTADLSGVSPDVTYFSKGDFHWAPAGSGDAAQKVAAVLKKLPAYGDISKQDFESEVAGIDAAERGALEEFIQQTCQTNIQLTTRPVWATHAKKSGVSSASSLLEDVAFPSVAVVGTSNSAEDDKFNFVGALKHFSRTDIYNAALTGGGFSSSSYRYYASEEYHEHPPRIIVWEFLPQHNYNNTESMNGFRQMIPAIYGACKKDAALADYSGNITQGQTEFFNKIKTVPLKNTYLYLDVTDPKERSLQMEALYTNGDTEQVELTRTTRLENNGKYFFELGSPENNNALFFHIITDTPRGHMTARICPYPPIIAEK